MCLIEETKKSPAADVSLGMITICPSTGDVVWDDFDGWSKVLKFIGTILMAYRHANAY